MNRLKILAISLTKYLLIIISVILFFIGILSIFITARLDNTFFHQSENTLYEFSFGIIPLVIAIFIAFFTYGFSKKIFNASANDSNKLLPPPFIFYTLIP